MAFVTRKITRTSQPQELVGYNGDLSIKPDIVLSAASSNFPMYGVTKSVSPDGIVFDGANASSRIVLAPYGPFYTKPFSIIFRIKRIGAHVSWKRIFSITNTGAIANSVVSALVHADGTVYFAYVVSGIEHNTYQAASAVLSSTEYDTFLFVHDGGKIRAYRNGKRVGLEITVPGFTALTSGASLTIGDLPNPIGAGVASSIPLFATALGAPSEAEAKSLSDNPWQIFEPIEETIWIPDGVSVTLPTLVQPASTTSAGAWTAAGAATLHEAIDEVTPSDADYISVAAASTCELVLAESAFPTDNVSLAYRALSSTASTLTVTLKQGATTIMTRTHALTGTATLYTQPLTAGEVAAIVAGPITCTLTSS